MSRFNKKKGGNVFWGVLFIVVGVVLLINYAFGIHLPLLRILISVGIIYIGFKMLFGSFGVELNKVASSNKTVFTKNQMKWDDVASSKEKEFDVVFGSGVLDLSAIGELIETKKVEINTVFGETTLLLNPLTPYRIKSEAVMGSVQTAGRKNAGIGENSWESETFDPAKPHLEITITSVFGSVKVETKQTW